MYIPTSSPCTPITCKPVHVPHGPRFPCIFRVFIFTCRYYFWANLAALNRFRAVRGLNTIPFRPHAGESGAAHHLASTFLVADGIAHGINLRRNLPIQYLYYLAQVPIAMSPLSNNALFLKLAQHPFKDLFARGLRVSLTTDGALVLDNVC